MSFSIIGCICILRHCVKVLTTLFHKSAVLPVHRVYLWRSTGPRVMQAGVCESVLTEQGCNSLTTLLIPRVLRGTGINKRKMGTGEKAKRAP